MTDHQPLTAPFTADPDKVRAGTPFAGQNTVGAEDADVIIENETFFPSISIKDFRLRRQIDDVHASERVMDCLLTAMIRVNKELNDWACKQVRQFGYETLAAVPSPRLGNCSAKLLDYHTAVYSTAQATLNHRHWAVSDTTAHGNNAESLSESADEYQRERFESLQRLRDEPRTLTGAL